MGRCKAERVSCIDEATDNHHRVLTLSSTEHATILHLSCFGFLGNELCSHHPCVESQQQAAALCQKALRLNVHGLPGVKQHCQDSGASSS